MNAMMCYKNYLAAKTREQKQSALEEIVLAVRGLISKANNFQVTDPNDPLTDFVSLCCLSRGVDCDVYLARAKESSRFVVVKQYMHKDGSWDLPLSALCQLESSIQLLEAQCALKGEPIFKCSTKTWSLNRCVQQLKDVIIKEHITFYVFKYYPIMFETVFYEKLNHDTTFLYGTINDLILSVATIHRAGVAHRDLKFQNLCFNKNGQVVLIDFDSAASIQENKMRNTLQVCTLHTRPPEHFETNDNKNEFYDAAAADWWAVGCVLAQMLLSDGRLFYDQIEPRFYIQIREFALEFSNCHKTNNLSSTNSRVKSLMRMQMPQELRTLLVGLLSLDTEIRKISAQNYIKTFITQHQ